MEELNKQISEKIKKYSSEQVGQLVLQNIELSATKQVLVDRINILNNELKQLKEKYEKEEVKDE